MWHHKALVLLPILVQILNFASAGSTCKAAPGTSSWPSLEKWNSLNHSVDGRLLQPSPPGAVCHPELPHYNAAACTVIQTAFFNVDFYSTDPISSAWPNWNNDSCWPYPEVPCTGEGFPIYVINATSKDDVKAGVKFAKENNVRLVVKASGHDYIGRSAAPNSLSIWTRHITGIDFQENFRPQGCDYAIDGHAVTFAAGTEMAELNLAASLKDLTILSGGQASVNYGGYATGGGHSVLGPTYGMAADQVLEFDIVTPQGDLLTINECQNKDLFWATRGGGGSTFGVITSTTIQTFPSTPIVTFHVLGTLSETEIFWDAMTYWLSAQPSLSEQGISGYNTISPNTSINGTYFGSVKSSFLLPILSPSNSSESLSAAINVLIDHVTTTWPGYFKYSTDNLTWATFYDWWLPANGPDYAGIDLMVGSRLLDEEALTRDLDALKAAIKVFIPPGNAGMANLVAGGKVSTVVPRGGSDAVNPAWRKAIIHFTNGVGWSPLDPAEKPEELNLLTNTYVEALRKLAPNMGAYVNEADANEPNFQQAFWGDNYPRLLDIKRRFDPDDVLWCTPCVGNERWEEVGDLLCKV